MISDADDSSAPKLVGRTQRILLELSTIFYFFARNAAIPLVQQYVYHLVARKYNLTEHEAEAAADADEGLLPVTNSSDDQLHTATDDGGHLVCVAFIIVSHCSLTAPASSYYAALLPRRGPHIASHSLRPSVCPSVRPSSYERHVAPPSELQ